MRPALLAALTGAILVAIFATMVVRIRSQLRDEIRRTIINRNATVLLPVAQRQLAQRFTAFAGPSDLLAAVLESAHQEDMLAVAIFDANGHVIRYAPDSLLFAELPLDDYLRLLKFEPISRFHADFPLSRYFAGVANPPQHPTPVLEVLLPLHGQDPEKILGFAQYYIDARTLAGELASIDERINRQTAATLGIGAALIAAVVAAAYLGLRKAQRIIVERTERLVRANLELTLAAKASALGQITSHLIHGLQGSVSSLRGLAAATDTRADPASDWRNVAEYTNRMQAMIQEAVALLGDSQSNTSFDLTGHELAAIVRQRNAAAAAQKGVSLSVSGGFEHGLDSHRGGLLCLITSNLVQNAIDATEAGRNVAVVFRQGGDQAAVSVSDEGPGIPDAFRPHLFEPGRTGRAGGSGLGLAISQLLARQIGATLLLDSTGPAGTTFRLTIPLSAT
ncbi:MAG TPA: sensor histidine kinase [Opitutaceae bacterium]